MTISLYKCSDDVNVLNKTLTTIQSNITIHPTSVINLLSPIFVITYNSSYLNCNYIYCSDLNRYYFVDSIDLDIGETMIIRCTIDVLYTYRNVVESGNTTLYVSRGLKQGLVETIACDVVDPQIKMSIRDEYRIIKSSKNPINMSKLGHNTNCYVITLTGSNFGGDT